MAGPETRGHTAIPKVSGAGPMEARKKGAAPVICRYRLPALPPLPPRAALRGGDSERGVSETRKQRKER